MRFYSQVQLHSPFGGVVPELAARDHLARLPTLIEALLEKNHLTFKALEGIAYTKGPGLMGALLVGTAFAQALGYRLNIPTVGVHHLEGHLLSLGSRPKTFVSLF